MEKLEGLPVRKRREAVSLYQGKGEDLPGILLPAGEKDLRGDLSDERTSKGGRGVQFT